MIDGCTPELENSGLLQVIYEDGKFYNQTTLTEVREDGIMESADLIDLAVQSYG